MLMQVMVIDEKKDPNIVTFRPLQQVINSREMASEQNIHITEEKKYWNRKSLYVQANRPTNQPTNKKKWVFIDKSHFH